MKLNKKIPYLLFTLVLSFSLCTSAFAAEVQTLEEPQHYITTLDKNGSYVNYVINDGDVYEIPLFSHEVCEDGIAARELTEVATLTLYTQTDAFGVLKLHFEFEPSNFALSLVTLGFTGTLTTFHNSGTRWGHNEFANVLTGSCGAASNGFGTLSGAYNVLGFDPVPIVYGAYT